jgi:hypothetical protein
MSNKGADDAPWQAKLLPVLKRFEETGSPAIKARIRRLAEKFFLTAS